jgi:serine/threonine protein kinase/tetratricopeptide (TPR) repeat protein
VLTVSPVTWTLSPGDVLAHYRVISPLGSGGMGQVFLAEDVRLGRKLALKVLAPRSVGADDLLGRFEREARSISALNHPNIITIYDTGHARGLPFIATEFIDGVTLRALLGRGRLDVRQALDIAIQTAQALVAAHATGVVHRDLKPENVMVRPDGYVKVLDFGLAKLTGSAFAAVSGEAATRVHETADGLVMGTVRYMAPEQARGEEIDARADIFALGVVLYEMLAGEPPFKGGTAADAISALLLQEPRPIAGVTSELDRLVHTAIRKERHARHQSCAQLLEELRSALRTLELRPGADTPVPGWDQSVTMAYTPEMLTPTGATPARGRAAAATARRRRSRKTIDSLAVLPLVNDGEDRELTYLGDGLTESLINGLSQMPRLRVMARSTVFRYRGLPLDPQIIGRDLGVQAVLTGHLAERGQAVVVSVELIDVEDGSQLWGAVLHRLPSDLFTLQVEMTRELTDALRLRLTREQKKRLSRRHTASPTAYQLYLRGRYLSNERTGQALKEAQGLFERAVGEDPGYALAYAGLADCRSLLAVSFRPSTVTTTIRQAREAALKALELDESLAEGHASLAFIKFRFDWEWSRAEAEFARAIELNPGHAPSRQWHAMFLASRSRFDAALAEMRVALDLDPLSLVIQSGLGRILHFARRFDEAAAQYEHVLQTNPSFGQAHVDLALTRLATGEYARVRAGLDRGEELMGSVSTILLVRGICAVREGLAAEGRRILDELQARHERGDAGVDDLALLAATLGDWDRALPWLREACGRRAPFLGYVDVEPAMSPFLTNPESRALLQQHGFDGIP